MRGARGSRGSGPDANGWTRPVAAPGPGWEASDPARTGAAVTDCARAASPWSDDTWARPDMHRTDHGTVDRSHTTAWPVVADHPVEQVWRLPLEVFHPEQFFPGQQRWPRSTTTTLRPVPDR